MPNELKKGLSGAPVRQLHQDLNRLGFFIRSNEYAANKFGPDTEEKIKAAQRKLGLPVTGILDAATQGKLAAALADGTSLSEATVKGKVSTEDSRPAAGFQVQLLRKELRTTAVLATGTTDARGAFSIAYDYPGRYDLVIRLTAPGGKTFDSVILFDVKPELEQNLVFGGGKYLGLSEFEQWMAAVGARIGDQALLEDLKEDADHHDITYLAGATGISVQKIMFLVLARRIEKASGISAGPVFALFRQKQPADLPIDLLAESQAMGMEALTTYLYYRLLAIPPEVQRGALLDAAVINQFPLSRQLPAGSDPAGQPWTVDNFLAAQVDDLVAQLQQLETEEAINLPFLVGTTPLKELLQLAGLNGPKMKQTAEKLVKYEGALPDFWTDPQVDLAGILSTAQIKTLRNTLELGAMVKNHLPVLKALKKKMDTDANFDAPGDFVSFTVADFEALIADVHAADPPGFPEQFEPEDATPEALDQAIKTFAEVIDANFETGYYTMAVAKKLATEDDFNLFFPGENPPQDYRTQVAGYIEANPTLDLRRDNLQIFIDAHPPATEGEKVKFFLKMLQRVARLTANKETLKFLVNNNLTNARRIYRMGKEAFLQKFAAAADETASNKLSRLEAEEVFNFAEKAYATTLATFTQYNAAFNSVMPAALGNYAKAIEAIKNDPQVKKFPDLQKLFGSNDFCETDPDQSVLSPAAYLVDILHFLTDRKDSGGQPVVNRLFERRPDLENIEFNHDNTRTPLPYIDLVNEILEAVALQGSFPALDFQTIGTAEELAANPVNENPAAYDQLADPATYPDQIPFGLPFHLWHREGKAYLDHLRIPRDELIELKNPATTDSSRKSIAAAYFGLSVAEANLILSAQNTGTEQKKRWGIPGTTVDLRPLNTVKVFLDQSGLSYGQMTDLLALQSVNGGQVITVEHMEECDTAKRSLKTLVNSPADTAILDPANRFIRLWRQLGWKMWEIDLCIQNTRIGDGRMNAIFLYRLRDFACLRRELGLPVEHLAAFYGLLNTADRNALSPESVAPGERPLFQTLFLNDNVLRFTKAGGVEKEILQDFSKLLDAPAGSKNIEDAAKPYQVVVSAALGIAVAELERLLQHLAPDNGAKHRLSLANLSALYRHVALAQSLEVGVAGLLDFLALKDVSDPFAGPRQTLEFVRLFKKARSWGLEAADWAFLTTPATDAPLALSTSLIAEGIQNVQANLPVPAGESELIQLFADSFGWDASPLGKLLRSLQPDGISLLAAFAGNIAKPTAVQDLTPSLQLLQKIFFLREKLRLTARELDWLLLPPRLNLLNSLPVKAGAAPISVTPLFELGEILALNKYYKPQDQIDFAGLLAAAGSPDADWFKKLEILTGWDATTLQKINAAFGLTDFTQVVYYQKVAQIRTWLQASGVTPEKLLEWAKPADLSQADAKNIKLAAKSKYEFKKWSEVTRPIQDVLREQKRDALVAFILGNNDKGWLTTDDLYAHFLLDVEMSACQPTSRIVQANAAVQLFVQRCFMNLEAGVQVDPDLEPEWKQWEWMKNYRVWEANRNVFLYPENWIEPELRRDKTPFFRELEEELDQNEVTAEYVEAVFFNYLEKLEQVARLDVCGLYEHRQGSDVTHYVIGRTKAHPQQYFSRKLLNGDRWTAWEKIEADIQAEQVMPLVFNNKLYVFWPTFSPEPKPMADSQLPQAKAGELSGLKAEPEKFWKVQLAWTALKNGKWQAKQLSKEILPLVHFRPEYSYHFKTTVQPQLGRVFFHVYFSESEHYRNAPIAPNGRPLRHTCDIEYNGTAFRMYKVDPTGSEVLGEAGRLVQNMPQLAHPDFRLPTGLRHKNNELINDYFAPEQRVYVKTAESARVDDGVLVRKASPPFALLIPHQDDQFDPSKPFFFKDGDRAFFVKPTARFKNLVHGYQPINFFSAAASRLSSPRLLNTSGTIARRATAVIPTIGGFSGGLSGDLRSKNLINDAAPVLEVVRAYEGRLSQVQYRIDFEFLAFYHPMVEKLLAEVAAQGIEGLMARKTQLSRTVFNFKAEYGNNPAITNAPGEEVDFDLAGPYAQYNWELFFHIPYLIAKKLGQNQRFEEALQWYSYIFNPTNIEADVPEPQRYWITKKFFQTTQADYLQQQITNLLRQVSQTDSELEKQIEEWRKNPFNPHLIAQYRTVAYQKNIVMRFIDNLLDWADSLFRRDTFETVNEATQLYVIAGLLLGPRPRIIPAESSPVLSFKLVKSSLDEFSNVLVETENYINSENATATQPFSDALPDLLRSRGADEKLLFGIPHNDYLLRYWDKLADRLYKIRHCLDIEGRFRVLALFAPPIDPALLVRAGAMGLDLSAVLNDTDATLCPYRFNVVWSKAMDLCNDVKSLGSALLSALEKKDAEALSLLRSGQELRLLEAVTDIRKKQLQDAELQVENLEQTRELIQTRRAYYARQKFMNVPEIGAFLLSTKSLALQAVAGQTKALASTSALVPNFHAGASGLGSPVAVADMGGQQVSSSAEKAGDALNLDSAVLSGLAGLAATMGSYERRQEEWNYQVELAEQELEQIQTQISAAQIRVAIAEKELKNHALQIEHTQATDEYLRTKYTNRQLYDWMIGQLSSVYFQTYQLACDLAKKAERSFRFELGLEDSATAFISFSYWDSLKKGLLSGEKLGLDLRRLDAAYLHQNVRQLELIKHISLAQLFPEALRTLKNTGACTLTLPEWLFDLDFPGHYLRRVKSVSLSIPCIAGPYTSINATLSLQDSRIRFTPETGAAKLKTVPFGKNSIATSSAQNDGGLFELNFRDERYLPFEGAGVAESLWRIEMPREHNQFDFETITDVMLHLRYTAREAGGDFKTAAKTDALAKVLKNTVVLINLRQEFSTEWFQFLHNAGEQILTVDLQRRLPFIARDKTVKVKEIAFFALSANPAEAYVLEANPYAAAPINLTRNDSEQYHTASATLSPAKALGPLQMRISKGDNQKVGADEIKEMFVLLSLDLKIPT